MTNKIKYMILMATYRVWHRVVFSILSYAYRKQIIDSYKLHELLALFDRTQPHNVLRKAVYRCLP